MARRQIDWLLFAVNRLGGTTKAAKKIGVSRHDVVDWMRHRVTKAPAGALIKLKQRGSAQLSTYLTGSLL